jgi:arylsulfatase A-like enzyme
MLTGLRPETSGVHMNNHDWRAMLPGVTTFMDHFKGHGYSTMGVGKIYHANYPDEDAWLDKIGSGRGLARPKRPSGLKGPGTKHDAIRARGERPPPVPLLYGPSGLEDHEHYDARTATQVLKVYENPPEGPLFMAVGFHAPHLPLTAPQKYFDVFKDVGVTPPVNPPGDRDDIYHRARTYNEADFPREEWRDVLLAFHACQMFIDVQVGRVLDALEASGRADRTIVVLSSDHGFMLGEHDMFLKTVFFEECTRVPLLMRVPWLVAPEQKTSSLVELVDLMATVVDLCDLPTLGGTDAISMRPLLVDPSRPWKKAAIQVFGEKRRSIVDGRWRLSDLGRRNAIELYDREADPREFHNLANDPAAAADKDRLMALLDAGWKACMPRV